MPSRIEQWMYPINKTDLDVLQVRALPGAGGDHRALPAEGLARIEIALAAAADPVRAAFAGDFLPRRIPGVRRAFRAGRDLRWCAAMHFIVSISGILIMSRHGVGDFVVQAVRRQECVANKRRRRQRRYGGRGLMKSNSGTILGLTLLAGLLTVAPRARRGCCRKAATFRPICSPPRARFPRSRTPSKAAIRWIFWWWAAGPRPSARRRPAPIRAGCRRVLKEKLPSVTVNLSVELQVKKTAEEVAAGLVKLVEGKKPTLVIWQTGTVRCYAIHRSRRFSRRRRRRSCCAAKWREPTWF